MSNRSSPAPFRTGPLSPYSPADVPQNESQHLSVSSDQVPQTPASPLMSVGAKSYATVFASSQASSHQTTSQHMNLSSPPSSAPMSTQPSQQAAMSLINSFPTPASSVNGHFIGLTLADDMEQTDKPPDARDLLPDAMSNPSMNATLNQGTRPEYRRTDHDRLSGDAGLKDESSDALCERNTHTKDDYVMNIDDGTVKRPYSDRNLESLQVDFASAFYLCKSSHAATGPDLRLDLVSLYGLGPVAKSVTRIDPVTGEKINRLRKSYEGKLKGLGLAGRNKPVKHEPNMPGGLRHLTMWPEEEWQNQKVYGKDIKVADVDSPLYRLQMDAMNMQPGSVPNNDYWEDVLGHEKTLKSVGSAETGKRTATPVAIPRHASQSNGLPISAEIERARPSRGRKRNYDDNSFVGYGEGYADDDDDDAAFCSNTEGSGKKRRKKEHISKVSTPLPERGGSYGVGMFGIGAR